MKILSAVTMSIVIGAGFGVLPTQADATTVSEIAAKLSGKGMSIKDKKRELLRQAREKIDPITTGSVRSNNEFDARGVVTPNAEVTLGAGISAKIEKLPFKEGQNFRKGDILVGFDCGGPQAQLRGANTPLTKAASMYNSKQRLQSRGAAGSQDVREAAADVATAKAEVDTLKETIRHCNIQAPFGGRIVERHAETFEIPAASAPILTVVDDSNLELDLIVPSSWLRWVRKGTDFEFQIDELGKSYRARVLRMGAKVDAVSQTIKMTGMFVSRPDHVLAGMSGTATFNPPSN